MGGREALRSARKASGMTQQQVAEKLGLCLRQYQRIESGESTGGFEIWDTLEDLFGIHQRKLRAMPSLQTGKADSRS